jgi:hypothetical protein
VKTVGRWRRLYQRRGVVRGANLPPPCFRCEGGGLDAGAYSYLFGLYLGDGHLVAGPRGGWRRWTRSSARSTDACLVAVTTTRRAGREPDAPVIVPAVRPQLKTPQPISRTSTAAGPSTQPA